MQRPLFATPRLSSDGQVFVGTVLVGSLAAVTAVAAVVGVVTAGTVATCAIAAAGGNTLFHVARDARRARSPQPLTTPASESPRTEMPPRRLDAPGIIAAALIIAGAFAIPLALRQTTLTGSLLASTGIATYWIFRLIR